MATFALDDASKLIEELLQVADDASTAATEKHTNLAGLGGWFLARAGQSLCSALILARAGLNGDAMSVARTVVEMTIDYRYIALEPQVRIELFEDYDHIANYKIASAVDELHGGKIDRNAMAILKQRHDDAQARRKLLLPAPNGKGKSKMPRDDNWAGLSIGARAREVDEKKVTPHSRARMHMISYADMCSASHSCYGSLGYASTGRNEDTAICFGPGTPDVKAADLAFMHMMVLTDDVREINGLDDDGDKYKLAERLNAMDAKRLAFAKLSTPEPAPAEPAAPLAEIA